jgi:hypothetical protein
MVLAIILTQVVWRLVGPDRLRVPSADGVVLQADGLPQGYEYLDLGRGQGHGLICGDIAWRIEGDMPAGGEEAIEQATELVNSMTGLNLERVDDKEPPGIPITFEFISAGEMAKESQGSSGGEGEAVGLARTWPSGLGIYRADVLLNEPFFEDAHRADSEEGVLTVLHELGHALGLGHSDVPDSVMYPYVSSEIRITATDVAAFRAVVPDC